MPVPRCREQRCVALCLLPFIRPVTLKGKISETSWEIEFLPTYSMSHRRKWKTLLDTGPHSVFAEENLNLCLSISELANHKSSMEVIDIMNMDLHFSVIYYQFQKRIPFFYFSEMKRKLLMKIIKMVLFLLQPNIFSPILPLPPKKKKKNQLFPPFQLMNPLVNYENCQQN